MNRSDGLWWAIAPESARLDPERYLGELKELPDPHQAGEWCEVTVQDREGPLRWRLIAVEAGRERSVFEERRAATRATVRAVGTGNPLDARRG